MVEQSRNSSATAHYDKGRELFAHYSRDSQVAAKREFARAIKADPCFARAYGWLAYALIEDIQEGWTDNAKISAKLALELASKGVELAPADYYTHWNLGSVHIGRKEFAKAAEEYGKALALRPDSPDLLVDMADMFSYLGQPTKAIELLKRAMSYKSEWWYHWSLGFAYFQKRDYASAAKSLAEISNHANGAYLLLLTSKNKLGEEIAPPAQIIDQLRSKDKEWTPNHLNRFPFVKRADEQHWLKSLREIGITVTQRK